MVNRNFYKKINETLSKNQQGVLITITEYSSQNEEILDDLTGEKILIIAGSEPIYSNQKLSSIIKDPEEYYNIKQPQMSLVEIDDIKIELYIEPLGNRPRLIIFGAGHVAIPVAQIGKMIDFDVIVVDDRENYANRKRFPEVDELEVGPFKECLKSLDIGINDYLVIITRGHKYDYQILKKVIESQACYIGMIGSDRKVKIITDQLREDNISEKYIEKVHAPIGFDIGSETPAEIAVAIAAELVMVRRNSNE